MIDYEYVEIPVGTQVVVKDVNGNEMKAIAKVATTSHCDACQNCVLLYSELCSKTYCQSHMRSDKQNIFFEQIHETNEI